MEKFRCGNTFKTFDINNFLECGDCGNHVCKARAKREHWLCPHCFGRLYKINWRTLYLRL